MNKIEWRHFLMLQTIRDTGSVSAAARSLGLTQSAASHQVKEAERRLGVPLLARRGRSVTLTQAGETLAESATYCAPLLSAAETKAQELGLGDAPRLRIAFGHQDGLAWVPDLFTLLRDRDAPMRLDLIFAGAERPPQLLRQNRAELAIDIGDIALPDIKRELIGEDELVCLVGRGHPLSGKARIAAPDIAAETYFAHGLTPQPGFEADAFFRPGKHVPRHVAQVESLGAILSLVGANAGISIQPRSALRRQIAALPIKCLPLAPRRLYLPWYIHGRPAGLGLAGMGHHGEGLLQDVARLIRRHLRTTIRK